MRILVALFAGVAIVGCGGSPTQPNPNPNPTPNPVPQPQGWTITGTVTTTLTGEPVAGATVKFTTQTVTTNSSGRWTLTGTGTLSSSLGVEVSAPGYLTRKTGIRAENGRDVTIDLIRDAAPFSLGFYRQLVRNDFDQPGQFQWTRRWTQAPKFYINIDNPKDGGSLTDEEIATITAAIRTSVPQATGGLFQAATIEAGSGNRPEQQGVIAVRMIYDPSWANCGRATAGSDPGFIEINYGKCETVCGSNSKIAPTTVMHEVGHTMGLYHAAGGMMDAGTHACGLGGLSAAEQHHAKLLYARPVGNADIDWDQPSTPLLWSVSNQPAPVVSCFRAR